MNSISAIQLNIENPVNRRSDQRAAAAFIALVFALMQMQPVFASDARGYAIQVFATQDEASATAAINRLRESHQAAYLIKAAIPGKGLFYRVRIGRFTTQKAAQQYAETLRNYHLATDFLVTGFEGDVKMAYTETFDTHRAAESGNPPSLPPAPSVKSTSSTRSAKIDGGQRLLPKAQTATTAGASKPDGAHPGTPSEMISPAPARTADGLQPVPAAVTNLSFTQKASSPRLKITVRTTSLFRLDEAVSSLAILEPQIVAAELTTDHTLKVTGLLQGETVIITSGRTGRRTLVIEVVARPSKSAAELAAEAARQTRASRAAGSFTLHYSPSFDGNPHLLRQRFDYTQKLASGATLRTSGDWFKFFGAGGADRFSSLATNFGMDRLSLGLSRATSTLDLLDSQLDITPLSLYGYTLRGLHYSSALTPSVRGLEIFAGLARPSPVLFGGNAGYLAGAMIPIKAAGDFRLRAGFIAVAPQRHQQLGNGGLVWQTEARYHANDQTLIEGELAYAESEVSWRSHLDLRRGAFAVLGESSHLDNGSPLVSIGAQSGGRQANYLSLRWMPIRRFIGTVSFNQVAYTPPANALRTSLNNSSFFANANIKLFGASDLGLRLAEQKIETGRASAASALQLATRTAALTYNARFKTHWSNLFEMRLTASREPGLGAAVDRGLSLREELRRAWTRWMATAYTNYNFNTPSLTGLVMRNASLLPPLLREAYEADPVGFLSANRGLLASLLGGIELPETRSLDVGLRFQGAFSRYNLSGDLRYDGGQFLARQRRNFFTTLSLNVRLDQANAVQVMAARSFLLGQKGAFLLTLSYTHRFGGGVKGFQFTDLLGLNEGNLQGRVFSDLNGDGQDEPNEPGVAGIKIQLNEKATTLTDARGRYHFSSLVPGDYTVTMQSVDLGIRQRASAATEQRFSITSKQNVTINFGVTSSGSVSGRVFNDLSLTGAGPNTAPGVAGVRVNLKPLDLTAPSEVQSRTVDTSGAYDFSNLAPGTYLLEIDPSTVPPDYRLPTPQSWKIAVEPLRGVYQDIPIAAQRAISGIVYIDRDGDGQFDPRKDEAVVNALVVCGEQQTRTTPQGTYLLRNLPAGKNQLRVITARKERSAQLLVELGAEPLFLRNRNLAVAPK